MTDDPTVNAVAERAGGRPGDVIGATLVSFFGAGYFPIASGTVGSFAALLVAAGIHWAGYWSPTLLLSLALGASVINVALGSWIERYYGKKDPSEVVIDEVAGMWIALSIPVVPESPWVVYPVAFFLFRILDIFKPLGARQLEQLPRGWGILLDDVLCGIYTGLVVWGGARLLG